MVRCIRKRKPGSELALVDVAQSSLGFSTRARSLVLEQGCEAPSIDPVSCYLELRSKRLEKPNQSSKDEPHCDRNLQCNLQEQSSHHPETLWVDDSLVNKSGTILNNLQSETGGRVHERARSFSSTESDRRSKSDSNVGSEAIINAGHSRSNSVSFPQENVMRAVSTYTKDYVGGEYPQLYWKPDSKQINEPSENNIRRNLKPMERFYGDNAVNHEIFILKDSDISQAHEGPSTSSLEREETVEEAPRSSSRTVTQFARALALNLRHQKLTDTPTVTEIEEFFEEDEKQRQIIFMTRYNFDPVNDVPLTGRFDWVRLQHE
ncbi:hypothetical protein O6H91_10G026400 [Diphasiastrum complanatum]|uniref:Uncharacterized protein n=1 Tax=Diphasiastrum complanatum TaxID=34168 RepID=A0ACC2CFA6_DIPCM|nr:hypothetical protein O6H91_10G026400 [Diphasiastrum complanatum]